MENHLLLIEWVGGFVNVFPSFFSFSFFFSGKGIFWAWVWMWLEVVILVLGKFTSHRQYACRKTYQQLHPTKKLPVANNYFIVIPIFNPTADGTSFCCPFSMHRFIYFCSNEQITIMKSFASVLQDRKSSCK